MQVKARMEICGKLGLSFEKMGDIEEMGGLLVLQTPRRLRRRDKACFSSNFLPLTGKKSGELFQNKIFKGMFLRKSMVVISIDTKPDASALNKIKEQLRK